MSSCTDVMEYHGLKVNHPMWIPTATKAARQGNAINIPRPPGYEKASYCVNYFVLRSGKIRWIMSYKIGHGGKSTKFAEWLTDDLPETRQRRQQRAGWQVGKVITINRGVAGDIERQVVVQLVDGLPYPVPVEMISCY